MEIGKPKRRDKMEKFIEKIMRKVLGDLLSSESLVKLAKAVVEKLLEDKGWVKSLVAKAVAVAEDGGDADGE